MNWRLFLSGALCVAAVAASGQSTIYVAPDGRDTASGGALGAAVASLPAALQRARQIHAQTGRAAEIQLRGGTYFLDAPLELTAEDSGLVISAYHSEHPVLSGGVRLTHWRVEPENLKIWRTDIPAARAGAWSFHELFVNHERRQRARLPKEGFFHIDGFSPAHRPTELPVPLELIDPAWIARGDVEIVNLQNWAQNRNQIRGINQTNRTISLAGDALPNNGEEHGRFWLENVPNSLGPSEWYLDSVTGALRYWPKSRERLATADIVAPRLTTLLRLQGSQEKPIRGVVLRHLIFADTDWPLLAGTDIDIQAAVESHGALQAEWASDCAVQQCVFTRLGGFAIDLGSGCQANRLEGNDMFDLGAGGVRVGDNDMRRANAFPTSENVIADNHLHDLGRVNLPAVGILIFLSGRNLISHNEIDHTFYTPISVGWSWGYAPTPAGGNIVEFNHLHDFGQGTLSDMGGVYTLGVQRGTIVRDNLIHDVNVLHYGGWGLYTDEGSTGITLESNIVYHCQSAGFHQHYGESNILVNNIFAFNQEAQLARTRLEKHLTLSFSNNIVLFDSGKLFSGNWGDDMVMDHNLFFDTRGSAVTLTNELARWQSRGHDLHSLIADPDFRDPSHFDFRLPPQSPARQIGFHPFSLKTVGPRPGKLVKYQP